MPVERTPAAANVLDVLDRVLDKGVVIDAWLRVSMRGIEIVTSQARVVVTSVATYLQHADMIIQTSTASQRGDLLVPPSETAAPRRPDPGASPGTFNGVAAGKGSRRPRP